MNRTNIKALFVAWLSLWSLARGAELRVDLSQSKRNDTRASHFIEWQVDPANPRTNLHGVRFALRRAGGDGRGLEGGLYKFGIDFDARLACDGIALRNDDAAAGLELVISGLGPGAHTIATYHNSLWPTDRALNPLNILVDDVLTLTNIQPSAQVTNDYDAASAFVRINAESGRDVVLKFVAGGSPLNAIVMLNGFEIDTGNPATKAIKPSPANDDEHVNADDGSVGLTWIAPRSAVSHDVYFGTNASAVAGANRDSPLFQGHQSSTSFSVANLNHFDGYFWRVDERDASGDKTRGDVWRFRARFPAFPTAEGYGRFARGGRAGRVIEVTHLNDSGSGSLRAAVEAEGPRTVVFNVSGLITLESKLIIRNPFLTLAGQTAPGKGICVRKFNLGMLGARDVIVRHLRVRPGSISGQTLDGMGMASSDHCIIDHCSISWTIDEAFSSRSARNITLQRTLISEALNDAGHKKYPPGTQHGYAASIGGLIGSFHHNLLAHCAGRNWSLAGGLNQGGRHTGWLDIRNNVVFNWKHRTTDGGAAKVNFVNNYYKPGPASRYFNVLNPERNNIAGFGPQDYHVSGNVMEGRHSADQALTGVTQPEPHKNFIVDAPFFDSFVNTQSAVEAYTNVLGDVGCNHPMLDQHDQRVIQEVRDGAAKYRGSRTSLPGLPDSQDDVGGWEDYPVVRRPADWDTDRDGMPDDWEMRAGLNPKNAIDGADDRNHDGYTNLEEYLGWLVREFPDPEKASVKRNQ